MTTNECKLYEILHNSDDMEEALQIAIKVFSAFLEQLEAAPVPQTDDLLVSS